MMMMIAEDSIFGTPSCKLQCAKKLTGQQTMTIIKCSKVPEVFIKLATAIVLIMNDHSEANVKQC